MSAKKRKKKKKSVVKTLVSILLILILLGASCFMVNYYAPDFFSRIKNKLNFTSDTGKTITDENGNSLKGDITESVVWPEGVRFAIEAGESFTFDVKLLYTDETGATAYGTIEDPLDLEMKFSNSAYCDKTKFDTIVIKQDAPENAEFMVTLKYKNGEEASYGFVVLAPSAE